LHGTVVTNDTSLATKSSTIFLLIDTWSTPVCSEKLY
jgi:hypothetical protein